MRRPLVAGNWKMNGSRQEVSDLLGSWLIWNFSSLWMWRCFPVRCIWSVLLPA